MDKNPGDRMEKCGGLMEPVGALKRAGEMVVMQQCVRCGFERNNKMRPQDNFDALVEISKKVGER